MSLDRERKILALVDEVLDLRPDARDAFLRENLGTDPTALAQAQSLLQFESKRGVLDATVVLRAFAAGEIVAERFRIVRFLKSGGMGDVYEAEDLAHSRHPRVALKTIRLEASSDPKMLRRFEREVEMGKTITHPNVCRIYDLGFHRDTDSRGGEHRTLFLTMELLDGPTLAEHLHQKGPLKASEAVSLLRQLAPGLSAAHEAGIVHRDFKPSNVILVASRGNSGVRAVITDFGLATEVPHPESTLSIEGPAGTPDYMSPEQVEGGRTGRSSDIYSLGVVLYELLTARLPFEGESALIRMVKRLYEPPVPPSKHRSDIGKPWENAILQCLERKPEDRFQSSLGVLQAVTGESPVPPKPARLSILRQARRRELLVATLVAAGMLAFPFYSRLFRHGHRPASPSLLWYQKGVGALRDGSYFSASKALERAVALDDDFPLAHARLAEAYSELDFQSKAQAELLRSQTFAQHSASLSTLDLRYLDALSLAVTGRAADAAKAYKEIADASPEAQKPEALIDLGKAYEKNKEIPKALSCYQAAATSDSQYAAAFLHLGMAYAQSNSEEAIKALSKAEELYRASSNTEGVAEALYQRGLLANNITGKLPEARDLLDRSLQAARLTGNASQEIRALLQLSSVSYKSEQTTQAQQFAEAALELARTSGADNLTARGLMELGSVAQVHGDPDGAESDFKKALAFASARQDARNEARASFVLGSLHIQHGSDQEGIREVEVARKYFLQTGSKRNVADCLTLLGRARFHAGDYTGALAEFTEQLKIAQEIHSTASVALAHEGLGNSLFRQENYPAALAHFQESDRSNESAGNQLAVAYARFDCGNTCLRLGRYREGRGYLATAARGAAAGHYDDLAAGIREAEAEALLMEGRLQDAEKSARVVLTLKAAEVMTVGEAKLVIALAQIRSGDTSTEQRACDDAVSAATRVNDPWLIGRARLTLAEHRLKAGNTEGALRLAQDVEADAHRGGRRESEYRSAMLAAIASSRKGDFSLSHHLASDASSALESFRSGWSAQDWATYSARADVRAEIASFRSVAGTRRIP